MRKRVALGSAIRAIREAKAQTDGRFFGSIFATSCSTSHAHLVNVEKGRKPASLDLLVRIADQLGVPLDAISYVCDTCSPQETAA